MYPLLSAPLCLGAILSDDATEDTYLGRCTAVFSYVL